MMAIRLPNGDRVVFPTAERSEYNSHHHMLLYNADRYFIGAVDMTNGVIYEGHPEKNAGILVRAEHFDSFIKKTKGNKEQEKQNTKDEKRFNEIMSGNVIDDD